MAKFTRELDELVANKIITPEVADNIRNYYDKPGEGGRSLLVIAFGIIGALLVGMGIVLIIAHNWDQFSIPVKLMFGLAPMFIMQVIAGLIILKSIESPALRESVAVLLIFAVATAIAIVSQVYNISGSLPDFILTWAVVTLPIMYLMKSNVASLISWIIITWYATESSWDRYAYYWLLAIAAIPYYIGLVGKKPGSNSVSFHNWIIGLSTVIAIANIEFSEVFHVITYINLFSIFMLIGQLPVFADRKLINNAWLIGGSAGIIVLLLFLTFEWPTVPSDFANLASIILLISLLTAGGLLYIVGKKIGFRNILSKSYTFIVFIPLFVIGLYEPLISRGLANVLLLALGVYTIREGALGNKLWRMNYGMMILSLLIVCRFFDTDMSFALRGLLFVAIGVGFFGMNYYMIRKKRISS